MLVDQVPEDLVEHASPDSSDRMHTSVLVDVGVDLRIGLERGGVEEVPDAALITVDPCAHGVVGCAGIGRLEADGGREEVTPALTHAAGFKERETSGIGGATGQTVRHTVRVLVDNNTGFERAVANRKSVGPDVHPHACRLTIGRAGKVGVVHIRSILGVEVDKVAS